MALAKSDCAHFGSSIDGFITWIIEDSLIFWPYCGLEEAFSKSDNYQICTYLEGYWPPDMRNVKVKECQILWTK